MVSTLVALVALVVTRLCCTSAAADVLNVTLFTEQTVTRITTESDCTSEIAGNWADGTCYYGSKFAVLSAVGHLAAKHFNERNGTYVKELAGLTCDGLQLSLHELDAGFSADLTVQRTIDMITSDSLVTNVVVGPASSSASIPTALILGARDIPQVSYWATSTELDKDQYKRFMRTIPTDADVAASTCAYWDSLGYKYTAMLFENEGYGEAYKEAIVSSCSPKIEVLTLPFSREANGQLTSQLSEQITRLGNLTIRAFLLVALDGALSTVVSEGSKYGLFNDSMWIMSDSISSEEYAAIAPEFRSALNGTLRIVSRGAKSASEKSSTKQEGPTPWDRFVEDFANLDVASLDGTEKWPEGWKQLGNVFRDVTTETPEVRDVATFVYDAVIAVGLGACVSEVSNPAGFGTRFYERSIGQNGQNGTSFEGLTGQVRFEGNQQLGRGNRDKSTARSAMYNVIFEPMTTAPPEDKLVGIFENEWNFQSTIVYNGGSLQVPRDVLRPDEQFNHPGSLRFVLYAMGGLNVLLALALVVWTVLKRNHIIVRASQVIFLACVAFGVLVSSSSVFLITFDDYYIKPEDQILSRESIYGFANTGCMGSVWLYSVGFTITFGALFARIWRIRRLFVTRSSFKRVVIPNSTLFIIIMGLLVIDVALLATWTHVDPLTFTRVNTDKDDYGNLQASVGTCSSKSSLVFLLALGGFHLAILVCGNYMAWTCRKINSTFAEARQVGIAMWSYVQVLALGIPVMVIVSENPETLMFVKGTIVFLNDFTLLLFLFGPKVISVHSSIVDTSGQGGNFFEGYAKRSSEAGPSFSGSSPSSDPTVPRYSFVPPSLVGVPPSSVHGAQPSGRRTSLTISSPGMTF